MTEYIKREDAIEAFYTATGDGDKADWAVGVIKSIPSADVVERKRGKWKVISVANLDLAYGGRIYVPEFKCNQCGSYYESYIRWDEPIMPEDADFPKFCPNCGADMRHPDD